MSVKRDQLADKLIEAHHLDKKIESNGVLKAFKDGVADGFFKGIRATYHKQMYYYKQGYDFGIVLYNKNIDKLVRMDVNEKK
tara:strand:+ start:315 stop:560 length:246 start_codon:yes stop_codon:yes gene_type:complete